MPSPLSVNFLVSCRFLYTICRQHCKFPPLNRRQPNMRTNIHFRPSNLDTSRNCTGASHPPIQIFNCVSSFSHLHPPSCIRCLLLMSTSHTSRPLSSVISHTAGKHAIRPAALNGTSALSTDQAQSLTCQRQNRRAMLLRNQFQWTSHLNPSHNLVGNCLKRHLLMLSINLCNGPQIVSTICPAPSIVHRDCPQFPIILFHPYHTPLHLPQDHHQCPISHSSIHCITHSWTVHLVMQTAMISCLVAHWISLPIGSLMMPLLSKAWPNLSWPNSCSLKNKCPERRSTDSWTFLPCSIQTRPPLC